MKTDSNNLLIQKLRAARWRAGTIMLLERAEGCFWRAGAWIFLFAGLWLLQVPQYGGHAGAILAFLLFLSGLIYFHYNDMRFFHWPRRAEIDRRIEEDSALPHRPLGTLSDELANPEKTDSRALWDESKKAAAEKLALIKPVRARRAVYDPYFARAAITVFLLIGIYCAGDQGAQRIWRGLTPLSVFHHKYSNDVSLVITPPAYTGLKQLIFNGKHPDKDIEIPDGSTLKAMVHGGIGLPTLGVGDQFFPFIKAGKSDSILEMPVPQGKRIRITQFFFTRASWPYKIIPDTPPSLEIKGPPQVSADGSARFFMTVADDYGVKTIKMRMEPRDISAVSPLGQPVEEIRSVMSPAKTALDIQPAYDLTSHPWAGMPVKFTFEAEDGAGQKTPSAPIMLTLPERQFNDPLAQEIIRLRKKLIASPLADYSSIRGKLEDILEHPQIFQGDIIVGLALRSASSRLYWADRTIETAREVTALLWDTALRLEDGNFSIAQRNLKNAQNALEQGLKNPNLSKEEISDLMRDLRVAMGQYFAALAKEMQKRAAEGKPMPAFSPEMLAKLVDPDSLAAMMSQMESQLASGDREAAQKMLSELQNMTDSLGSGASMPPDMKDMMQSMKDLQDLIAHQQTLLDKTTEQANIQTNGGNTPRDFGKPLAPDPELMKKWNLQDMPPPPAVDPQKPAALIDTKQEQSEQETLRHLLGDIMLKAGGAMGKIPVNLGMAEQEMRGSSKALGDDQPADAAPHEKNALTYLKLSQKEISKQFAQRLAQMTGISIGSGMKYDPLGRPYGDNGQDNATDGSMVKIPNEAQRKQAQEIRRLLEQRSGQLDRPEQELDYYRRLLRQF